MYGKAELEKPDSFNYYKYMGSFTSPPCAENVVWFVVEEEIPLGSTALSQIHSALLPLGKTEDDKPENLGNANR